MNATMQNIGRMVAGCGLACCLTLNLNLQAQTVGTFYLASQGGVPYPFDPYGGAEPIETLNAAQHIYLIEDSPDDFAALQTVKSAMRVSSMSLEAESSDAGGGGFAPLTFGPNDLWLEITGLSPDKSLSYLVIHPPQGVANGVYDLYATTNLSAANWIWLLRCDPGQTNLTVTNFSTTGQCFFRLATANIADSDNDGLSDALELQLGTDPHNAYSQDSTHTHKDGEWYLTAVTGGSHTRASIMLDTVDSYYDSTQGITYLYFAVSGVTTNDQFDVYIQTPSTDTTDTNKVWQDMFADMGHYDYGFINGTHWVVTAWPGNVPLDGSVKFAELDNQDRDYDGLQDGYEILATHTVVGTPDSSNDGIADGDEDLGQDGFSNVQKWQYGLNPFIAVSTTDSMTNGLPDWFRNYIIFWYGSGAADPWADADGNEVPNIVEFDLGTDPTVQDFWGAIPPPSGQESISLQYTVNYGASGQSAQTGYSPAGASDGNPYFPDFGLAAGPLGEGCSMDVNDDGVGTVTLDCEVWPLNQAYNYYAPFVPNADPAYAEFQEPDPLDGDLYRSIAIQSTHLSEKVWTQIEPNVLQALRSDTLEYVHAVSMLKIQLQARKIQWLEYAVAQGADGTAVALQIENRASIIHTEMTKITAIDMEYVRRFPNLDWIDRSLRGAGFLACGISWYADYPALLRDVNDYKSDVQRHVNYGAADILSSHLQSLLQEMPGLPNWFVIGLDPSVPIFSLNGPLGWYDGY